MAWYVRTGQLLMKRNAVWRYCLAVAALVMLSACQAMGENVDGTIQADLQRYETESAELAVTAVARRTEVAATADASGTRVAQDRNVNQQIYQTLVAGSTPTVALIAGESPAEVRQEALQHSTSGFDVGDRLFIKTGVSDQIDGSGCVVNPRSSFPASTQAIYATVRAYNVQAGTPMRAQWLREAEMVMEEHWAIDQSRSEYCLWFRLDSSQAQFIPGAWSVILTVDAENFPLEDPTTFFITES
jgi:hypothetical protein